MKQSQLFPLLLFCLSLSHSSQGQFFERNFQGSFYNHTETLRAGNGGDLYWVTLGDAPSSLPTLYMHRIDKQGNDTYFPMFSSGIPVGYDWLSLADGYIATGRFFECDILVPRRFVRFDEFGDMVWEKEISSLSFNDNVKLLPGPSNSFWTFDGQNPPVLYNPSGDSIGVASVTLPLFIGVLQTADGKLLTYGIAGVALYNQTLTSQQFGLQNTEVLKADTLAGGGFVALTPDKLIVLDADLDVVKEKEHNLQTVVGVDMNAGASGVWLLTTTPTRQLLRYDTALVLQSTQPIPDEAPFLPYLINVDDERVALVGDEYRIGHSQVTCVRSTAPDDISFDATPDAALLDVTSAKPPVGYYYQMWGHHTINFDSVVVTPKNEGSGTLNEVTLNAIVGFETFICQVEYHYQQKFTNLNLLPGQSVQLEVGEIELYGMYNLPATTSLCFWTTLPNDSLDHIRQNNSVCRTFNIIVAADEPQQVSPLQIFPNPAADFSLIKWPGEPGASAYVRLYDLAGRLISKTQTSEGKWTLQRGNLPAGFYQVIVASEEGRVFSGKIVFD